MKLFRIVILIAAAAPMMSAASKEMIELQRDVATLQDQVRQLNEKLVALTTMMQQSLENTRQTNVAILAMQDRVADTLRKQQENVAGPIVNVGQKLDQMSQDFGGVRETVMDLNSRIGKLDSKVTDLANVVQTLKSMPAPPPPVTTDTGVPPAAASAGGAIVPPAGMKSETAYTNAYRDYIGGNYDLAMQEFSDFLKYFPAETFAPNAQYYIGDIYFKRKDYDNAVQAFDSVLEHYSNNPKTPDAHLMKGRSLQAEGKRDAAAKEYKDIIARYPDSDAAAKAKTLLKEVAQTAASTKPRKRH